MTQNLDLCSTCIHASDCTYRIKSDRYIYYCEEFEIEPAKPRNSQTVVCEQERVNQQEHDSSLKGLCTNCENRKNCKFSGVEGGVWHCEEYR